MEYNAKKMNTILNNLNENGTVEIFSTLKQLPLLAQAIHNILQVGDWVFLDGDLGSGKTALAKELSVLFGLQNFFTSPTFSILNNEKLPTAIRGVEQLLHLDLYRLKSGKELYYIGLEQEFRVENSIALFEWPDVLDEEEWENFFNITGCSRPKRILRIQIDGSEGERSYVFSFLT
ncbi:MAG: tRNA (adenosine(37)-N6)-threonylcarbamoyltransferase complex ATPase subunit type 1 TsaE [Bdellovibrionota bacterium]